MAVKQPQIIAQFNLGSVAGLIVHWDNITENDSCGPFDCLGYADKSIDINGSFGGGTIAIHGANHPTQSHPSAKDNIPGDAVYSVLTDSADNDIDAIAADKKRVVMQHTCWIKPVRTAGSGMDVDITMIVFNGV